MARKRTAHEKRILKKLIDADVTAGDVANYYGHTPGNVNWHMLRGNDEYFDKAIHQIKKSKKKHSEFLATG